MEEVNHDRIQAASLFFNSLLVIRAAKTWMSTAAAIERRVADGAVLASPDPAQEARFGEASGSE